MRTMPLTLLALSIALSALCTGCDAPKLTPSSGDLIPEVAISGATLASTWTVGDRFATSPILDAPLGATRAGFMLDVTTAAAGDNVVIEARARLNDGNFGDWRPAVVTFAEDLLRVGYVDLTPATGIQLRVPTTTMGSIDALVFSAVVPMPARNVPSLNASGTPVDLVSGPAVTHQALDIVGVQPRSAWGAAPTRCTSLNTTKTRVSVHHTVTPTTSNGSYSARIRGIQSYHQDTRNWCDIGYHFMVTLDGTTWEAREAKYLGTHVGNQNTNNIGVSYVGCFQESGCNDWGPFVPPQAMIDGGGELIGKLAVRYGITVSPSTVMGHRDNPGQSTSCPGANLHSRLDDIRAIANNGETSPQTGIIQGVIWDLSVTSDAGASMELGARIPGATITASDGTVATAREDDAFWALTLAPGEYVVTAAAPGYASTSREVQVVAGGTGWSSMGVAPAADAVALRVVVQDAVTTAPIALATVEATGADPGQTDVDGAISFSLAPGAITVNVSAEGYEDVSQTWAFASGATDERIIALTALVVNEPETPSPEGGPEGEPSANEPDAPTPDTPSPESGNPEPGEPEGASPEADVTFEPDIAAPEGDPSRPDVSAPLTDDRPTVVTCSSSDVPHDRLPLSAFALVLGALALVRRRR